MSTVSASPRISLVMVQLSLLVLVLFGKSILVIVLTYRSLLRIEKRRDDILFNYLNSETLLSAWVFLFNASYVVSSALSTSDTRRRRHKEWLSRESDHYHEHWRARRETAIRIHHQQSHAVRFAWSQRDAARCSSFRDQMTSPLSLSADDQIKSIRQILIDSYWKRWHLAYVDKIAIQRNTRKYDSEQFVSASLIDRESICCREKCHVSTKNRYFRSMLY